MALLEVRGLTKRFGGLIAVNDVSFDVEKGEVLGIIGPNGAGKTTLFSLISGFQKPDMGSVVYNGESILGLPPHKLVQRGMVRSFQIVQTFADMTVLDVVTTAALARRPLVEAIDHARQCIARVGLAGKEEETPATLSLQDKKLMEVAKCIATDATFILLDEVMAGLTLGEAEAPLKVIQDLNAQGVTVLMVEHVMPVIMRAATRMVVINFGEKIAEGPPAQVVEDPRVVEAYFGEHGDAAH